MSKAKSMFENHLLFLREQSSEKDCSFDLILRGLIKQTSSKSSRIADMLIADPVASENKLIELYRVEFYEWLANHSLELNEVEIEQIAENKAAKKVSAIARSGGLAKSDRYKPLKDLAKQLVTARNFKSRRQAVKTITPEVFNESIRLGISLSKDQAEITINGWLKEMGLPANI